MTIVKNEYDCCHSKIRWYSVNGDLPQWNTDQNHSGIPLISSYALYKLINFAINQFTMSTSTIAHHTRPVKRHKQLLGLSYQNHDVLLFVWRIRQGMIHGIPPSRIRQYCDWLWNNQLREHYDKEKTAFLTVLDPSDVFLTDVVNGIESIENKFEEVADNGSYFDISRLAEIVYYHVRFEERYFLPHIEKTLNDRQLEEIGKLFRNDLATLCNGQFHDPFWIKTKSISQDSLT
jgi:hypothetical protein